LSRSRYASTCAVHLPHFAKIQGGSPLAFQRLPRRAAQARRENSPVNLGRIAWLVAALACLVTVLILVLEGYYGYAGVTFAVAVAAGINLF
jgi:hypothetical protein